LRRQRLALISCADNDGSAAVPPHVDRVESEQFL